MASRNFFAELKRRNVYKVAVAYVVAAWLLIQVATQVFPFFEVPNWAVRLVVLLLILGFPPALILSWAFEITPEGIKRESEIDPVKSTARKTGRKIVGITVAVAVVAAGMLAYQLFRPKDNATSTSSAESLLGTVIPSKSIAVLPFDNLSDDKSNAYFTEGVQDEILTDLARIADLKVISRTSVMQYKSGALRNLREIGQQLGVAHLLEGSVQRAANKVRVNAQLINARADAHEWAESYDRPVDDVFAIQSEIAAAIAAQLRAKISPEEKRAIDLPPTADVLAFDLYSRAKTLNLMAGGLETTIEKNLPPSIDLLNQAVARDPSFLPAYCLLAFAHDRLYTMSIDRTPARLALAQAALDKAAQLQPEAGETHLARAYHLYWGYRDYPGALAELEKARETLPNESRIYELRGYILRRQGKDEEGLRFLERALELDPRNFVLLSQIAISYNRLRRYREAAASYDRALSIYPDNFDTQLLRANLDLNQKADTRALRRLYDELRQKDPAAFMKERALEMFDLSIYERNAAGAEAAHKAMGKEPYRIQQLEYNAQANAGLVARLAGNDEKARAAYAAALEEQKKTVQAQPDAGPPLAVLAFYEAQLGRKEEALRDGRRAMELLPVEKDSINGPLLVSIFAATAARVGEKDLALEYLTRAAQLPGGVHYGDLKLHVDWDPLRGYPPFEALVASLAPKDTK